MVAYRKALKISALLFASALAVASCDYKPRNQGKVLYDRECQSCHMENGQGLGSLMPPLANADFVMENQEQLACIIRNGMEGNVVVNGINYSGNMPANKQLTDVEIANLVHYIIEVLNEQPDNFTIQDVRSQLESCP